MELMTLMGARMLDLYCKAGGASCGYARAGFEVVGVDIEPQPRYPYEFVQADAIEYAKEHGHEFDAIAASPPCHDHTALKSLAGLDGTGHLVAETRTVLNTLGRPYVIENVPGAPVRPDVVLCGTMFGLRVYRHRLFELGGWWMMTPAHPRHTVRASTKKRRADWDAGLFMSVTGDAGRYVASRALDIDWMIGDELSHAIPPAYTQYIGEQLMIELARA